MAGLYGIGNWVGLNRPCGGNRVVFHKCQIDHDHMYPDRCHFFDPYIWFPTMRYELDQKQLTLHYGPVLTYRIPLREIRTIRSRNLSLTVWSTIRFPGIALFTVPYADVGNVKICATAALNDILLIETDKTTRKPKDDLSSKEIMYWQRQGSIRHGKDSIDM